MLSKGSDRRLLSFLGEKKKQEEKVEEGKKRLGTSLNYTHALFLFVRNRKQAKKVRVFRLRCPNSFARKTLLRDEKEKTMIKLNLKINTNETRINYSR